MQILDSLTSLCMDYGTKVTIKACGPLVSLRASGTHITVSTSVIQHSSKVVLELKLIIFPVVERE